MGTLPHSWRKAYGAIKDSTTVSLAKVNSEFKDLDVAIVKSTNHVERPPKERHIRKIFIAASEGRPRTDVSYCVHALSRRLNKTHNWVVALKTLIVIHRTLREGDSIFRDELLSYSRKGHVLQISNFKDDSSPLAWDCSAWVRTYAMFLEERIECFKVLNYDIESEKLIRPTSENPKGHSRTRHLKCEDLLEQLPALQQLLFRLVGCQPEGMAFGNYLIQYALALILKESFKIYCALNDGIINLVDMYFEMPKLDAIKGLDIYKRAGQLAKSLADFYGICRGLDLARHFQFPVLREPPPNFVESMEEYIREAPRVATVHKTIEYQERSAITSKLEEEDEIEEETSQNLPPVKEQVLEEEPVLVEDLTDDPIQDPIPVNPPEPEPSPFGDLLGLNDINPVAAELEENNALALAIMPSGENSNPGGTASFLTDDSSGWELALVTADTSNTSLVTQTNLAGGFDKLLLDSLYEDTSMRESVNMNNNYGAGSNPNPFNINDPFAMSNSIAPPTNVQMSVMMHEQQNMMMYQQQTYQHQQYNNMNNNNVSNNNQQYNNMNNNVSNNPFGDPFMGLGMPAVSGSGNIGSSSLI